MIGKRIISRDIECHCLANTYIIYSRRDMISIRCSSPRMNKFAYYGGI